MSNATVEKAVTFSTFPATAHKDYAIQTKEPRAPKVDISTQIHTAEVQLSYLDELFGCVYAVSCYAAFELPPKFKFAGKVFKKKLLDLDIDAASDLLQDFIDSHSSLTEGHKRSKKALDELITTTTNLNRILELIRGYMCQYAKG